MQKPERSVVILAAPALRERGAAIVPSTRILASEYSSKIKTISNNQVKQWSNLLLLVVLQTTSYNVHVHHTLSTNAL